MQTFLTILYVLVCLFLIVVVLLQSGKGGGLGGAIGGGTSQQVFGGAGAGNILTRMTAICAALFMALAIVLEFMSSSGDRALDRAIEASRASGAQSVTGGATVDEGEAQGASTPTPGPTSEPTE